MYEPRFTMPCPNYRDGTQVNGQIAQLPQFELLEPIGSNRDRKSSVRDSDTGTASVKQIRDARGSQMVMMFRRGRLAMA